MITFETNSSPFFTANKQYCDNLVAALESQGAEFTGECSSYGYRVEARFKKAGLAYKLLFVKYQITQNGVVIPKDANEYAGTEFRVSGIQNSHTIKLGKGSIKRLFTFKKYKDLLPRPFYLFSNHPSDHAMEESLIPFIREQGVDRFTMKNGNALIRIHKPVSDPRPVIENIERVLRGIS